MIDDKTSAELYRDKARRQTAASTGAAHPMRGST